MKRLKSLLSLLGFILWVGVMLTGGMAITALTLKMLVHVAAVHWLKDLPEMPFETAFLLLAVIAAGSAVGFAFYAIMQGIAARVINK